MSRNRAAAIVVYENQLLVIHRKNTEEYYTFPGGGVEPGETNQQAAKREIMEEASLDITIGRQVYELHHDSGDVHYYFLAQYVSGTPAVQPGSNEYADNLAGVNTYMPQWLPLARLATTELYPIAVRDRLITDLRTGFSDEVVSFDLPALPQQQSSPR